MALIKCSECGKEISDKVSACPNCGYKNKNIKNYIIYVIVGLIVAFIAIMFLSKVFNMHFSFENGSIEKHAICSNNSNTIDYVEGNKKKTHINHNSHAESYRLSDDICGYLKKIAYYYDKNANVQCGNQDFYATYYRQNSFDDTVNDYINNQKYHCIVYDNKENKEKDKIIGSWCGYRYDNTKLKYKFNTDGTIEETTLGTIYEGYYSIKDNNISYGVFLTSNDYYIILQDNYFYYDEGNDTINLTSKMIKDKYNTFSRCD